MIPKILHTVWISAGPHDPVPPYAEKNFQRMKDMHPTWDVRMQTALPEKMPADILKVALEAEVPEQMSDIVRYWLMYKYGGIYIDLDMVMWRPLDPLMVTGPFIGQVHGRRLEIACIGSEPGEEAWMKVLEACVTGDINKKDRMCYGPNLFKNTDLSNHFNLLETEYFYFPQKPLMKFYKADEAGKKKWIDTHCKRVEPYAVHCYMLKPKDG